MDILKAFDQLHSWISEWEKAKSTARKNVLKVAADSCRALIGLDKFTSDEATMLHEKVRVLYRDISTILRGHLGPGELEIVINALASARIYYWIRIIEEVPRDLPKEEWEEAWAVVLRRGRLMKELSPSAGIVYHAMVVVCQSQNPEDSVTQGALTALRAGCVRDFAQLDVLVLKYESL